MKDYLNLIRETAWSFHRTTGVNWDDLFGEACVAYCQAINAHENGTAKSTLIFSCIRNRLANFCRSELRNKYIRDIDWYESSEPEQDFEFFETSIHDKLSKDSKSIVNMILKNPRRYALPPRKALGKIRYNLRNRKKWNTVRINRGMKKLRKELTELY